MDINCEHGHPFGVSAANDCPLHRIWRRDLGEAEWSECDAPPPSWTSADPSASHYRRLSFGYPAPTHG